MSQHESRQEEAIRHLAEAVLALSHAAKGHDASRQEHEEHPAMKAEALAKHVLALVAVDATETDPDERITDAGDGTEADE